MPLSAENHAQMNRLTLFSMTGAGLMMGYQIAAKAARDGLFLSSFPVTDLPKVIGLAALLAIVLGLVFSKLLSRFSPATVMPFAVLLSGLLHLGEYFCLELNRGLVVTLIYLHIVSFGAILLSGFWSVATEAFDPREAKLRFGRIAGAGTAGGVLGGLIAERTAYLLNAEALLLVLAGLHFLVCGVLTLMQRFGQPGGKAVDSGPVIAAAQQAFRRAPFLLSLASLVLLGTMSAALLDYLFKSGATQSFGKGPELTRYFAMFYTGAQLLTFLVQSVLTPIALEKLGLGRTVMSLGLSIIGGSAAALAVPAFGMTASVRAVELILRGSFFRSGYELFFTPIPAQDKRAVKTVIDVSCDRFGDALAAGLLQLLLLLGPTDARVEILLVTIGLSAASVWITLRMDKAYVHVLEQGLLNRAVELDISEIEDSTTMSAVLASTTLKTITVDAQPDSARPGKLVQDPVLGQLARLRSGDATEIRGALSELEDNEVLYVPQVIRLLAWDEVAVEAREVLQRQAALVSGQLSDVLLDERQDFAVRRRVPRILARCSTQRVFDSLLAAQMDDRFEIRFQASRALDFMHQRSEELLVRESEVFSTVIREMSVSRPIWEGRKLLDARDVSDSGFTFLDEVLKERSSQSLEHVFSLLSLILPREPLKLAFRALHSEDTQLLGLGLEYLSSTLPESIYRQLTQLLESIPVVSSDNQQEVPDRLVFESGNKIAIEIRKKGADALSQSGTQSTARPE